MDCIERTAELKVIQKSYNEIVESQLQYNKMDFPQLNDEEITDIFNYSVSKKL